MYECVHCWEKVITYTQLTMTGEELEIHQGLCALCGRWYELPKVRGVELVEPAIA